MKRKVASIALSVAILGGGLLGAAPANAASSPIPNPGYQKGIALFDADIKKTKENLRIEKVTRVGDKTVGNANDKKARDLYMNAWAKDTKMRSLVCEANAMEQVSSVITKNSASHLFAQKAASIKSEALYREARHQSEQVITDVRQSDRLAKLGNTFSHQRKVLNKFTVRFEDKGTCESIKYKSAKAYSAKYSNSLGTQNKKKIDKVVATLKQRSERATQKYVTQIQPNYKKSIASYTHYKNLEISKLEKKVKNLEKGKAQFIKDMAPKK